MPSGKKLTPSLISRIPLLDQGQEWHWDSQVVGFALQVGKTAKSYICQCRGKRITLGRADVLTVDEARTKALDFIRAVERGEDPRAQVTAARTNTERLAALTLRVAMDETLAAKAQFARPKTLVDYRLNIENYLPQWLDRPLSTISANDVTRRFNEIVEGKNLGQRRDGGKFARTTTLGGGRVVAAKVMVAFRVIWNFARWQHGDLAIPECPVGVLGKVSKGWAKVGARERIVTDLPAFVSVAGAYPNPIQRDLVLLLLWTGLRMNEACRLRWSEVDLDAGILSIPAERMKAGRPLNIPLTRLAFECLQRRAAAGRDASGYVFPGKRMSRGAAREGFATVSKAILKVLSAALNGPTSPHDWRRTFTTIALNAGVPLQAVEVLTAHRSSGVTLQHYYAPRLEDLRAEVAKIDAVMDRHACMAGSGCRG